MIIGVTGKPRSGKSYRVMLHMAQFLANGGTFATNIEIYPDEIIEFVGDEFGYSVDPLQIVQLTQEQAPTFWKYTAGGTREFPTLVAIDEAADHFDAHDWKVQSREGMAFFRQHGHSFTDILLLCHSVKDLDGRIRRLVHEQWRCNFGRQKPILGVRLPIFACQKFYGDGGLTEFPIISRVDTRIFKLYNSHQMGQRFVRLEQGRARLGHKIEKKKGQVMWKYIAIIALVIVVVLVVKSVSGVKEFKKAVTPSSVAGVGESKPLFSGSVKPTSYDIFAENFVSFYGSAPPMLVTDQGVYQRSVMSRHGLVTAVSDRMARIEQPSGRVGWVVADAILRSSSSSTSKQLEPRHQDMDRAGQLHEATRRDILDRNQQIVNGMIPQTDWEDVSQMNIRLATQPDSAPQATPVPKMPIVRAR